MVCTFYLDFLTPSFDMVVRREFDYWARMSVMELLPPMPRAISAVVFD